MVYGKLDPHFFTNKSQSVQLIPQLIQKWQSLGKWSPACFPIYEWEGLLYVAFAGDQPPRVKQAVPMIFLNCDENALAGVFAKFPSETSLSSNQEKILQPEAQKETEPAEFELLNLEDFQDSPEASNEPTFSGEQKSVQNIEEVESPEGFNFASSLASSDRKHPSEDGGIVDMDALAQSEAPQEALSDLSDEPLDQAQTVTNSQIKPPSAPAKAKTADPKPVVKTVQEINFQAQANSGNYEGLFEKMRFHFKKSMLLKVEDDTAKPWKWSAEFKRPKNVSTLSFQTPSPFRIVAKTHKPYHGPVAESEVIYAFFQEWNDGVFPEHLTVVPILKKEQLTGFLLGIGTHEAGTQLSLTSAERLAFELADSFFKVSRSAA